MLSGRLDLRRGITVIFGCFLLFGASGIAAALTGLAGGDTQVRQPTTPDPGQLSGHLSSAAPPTAYDPYAGASVRSEEHTSELQSLMRISYAVFCLKKKK